MKVAVFPGSFDPITVGHIDILNRMSPLFDKIIIGIGGCTIEEIDRANGGAIQLRREETAEKKQQSMADSLEPILNVYR